MNRSLALLALTLSVGSAGCNTPVCGKDTVQHQKTNGELECLPVTQQSGGIPCDVDAGATQADRESGRTPSASSPPGTRRDSPSHIIAQPRGWAAPSSAVPKSTTARRCGTAASFTRSGTGRFRTAAPAAVRTLCSCGRPFGPTAARAPASQQTEPLPGGCGRAPERACQLRGRGDAVLAKEGQDVDVAGLEAEARQGRQARGSRTGGGLLADEMDRVS